MVFEYVLTKNILPIYSCDGIRFCLDTGATISTFFMDIQDIKKLYPDCYPTSTYVRLYTSDLSCVKSRVYCIPEFRFSDSKGRVLFIKNFMFTQHDGYMGFDVLIAGCTFYNTRLTITPRKLSNKFERILIIETKDDIDTLNISERYNGKRPVGYVGLLQKQ